MNDYTTNIIGSLVERDMELGDRVSQGPLHRGGLAAVITRPPDAGEQWLKAQNGDDLFVDFSKVCLTSSSIVYQLCIIARSAAKNPVYMSRRNSKAEFAAAVR